MRGCNLQFFRAALADASLTSHNAAVDIMVFGSGSGGGGTMSLVIFSKLRVDEFVAEWGRV